MSAIALRIFHIAAGQVSESAQWPQQMPEQGFIWLAIGRAVLQEQLDEVQATLQRLCGQQLVDLHVSDLLNLQLPSHYDYTSQYDLLVFRRLTTSRAPSDAHPATPAKKPGDPSSCAASIPTQSAWPSLTAFCCRYTRTATPCGKAMPPACSKPARRPAARQAPNCPPVRPT
jgi:hypothetical protein